MPALSLRFRRSVNDVGVLRGEPLEYAARLESSVLEERVVQRRQVADRTS